MKEKQLLRQKMRHLLDRLSDEEVYRGTQKVTEKLESLTLFRTAETFFIYVSQGREVGTHALIDRLLFEGKRVCVPKLDREKRLMMAVEIGGREDLVTDRYGLHEPLSSIPYQGSIDLALVPCIAVTPGGYRLGAGGGYYDRYFADHPEYYGIVLAHSVQVIEDLPVQIHDQRMQEVVWG